MEARGGTAYTPLSTPPTPAERAGTATSPLSAPDTAAENGGTATSPLSAPPTAAENGGIVEARGGTATTSFSTPPTLAERAGTATSPLSAPPTAAERGGTVEARGGTAPSRPTIQHPCTVLSQKSSASVLQSQESPLQPLDILRPCVQTPQPSSIVHNFNGPSKPTTNTSPSLQLFARDSARHDATLPLQPSVTLPVYITPRPSAVDITHPQEPPFTTISKTSATQSSTSAHALKHSSSSHTASSQTGQTTKSTQQQS